MLVGLALFCVSLLQSLLGKPMRRDLKFTSRQIQPSCNFSINPTESKRTISKRNRKRLFWKGYSVESPLLTSEIAKYTPSPACLLMLHFSAVRWGGTLGRPSARASAGSDRGVCGVFSSRGSVEGTGEGCGLLQIRGGRAH